MSNSNYYKERLNIVTEYINNNLDKRIYLDELAQLSHFSKFHFHKITRSQLGESIGAYITRLKMENAARQIRFTSNSIEEIAYSVGYETPTSLSKQFKNMFGVSPNAYRNKPMPILKEDQSMETKLNIKKAKIVTLDDQLVIYLGLHGAYKNLDYQSAWETLWSVIKEQKLFTAGIRHIGIPYDDPGVTSENRVRYEACLAIHKKAIPSGDVGVKKLLGGKFAMFHYTGSYHDLPKVYDHIFNRWLLHSEHELRDEPVREIYRNNPKKTEEAKLKTEIYIPIN